MTIPAPVPLDHAPVVEVTTMATTPTSAGLVGRLRALLSTDEGARADRFVRDRDRDTYILAHALTRVLLARHAPTAPADWRFEIGTHGCPSVVATQAGDPRLSFNLSHTDGLVAVAVSRGRLVGVDVERVERDVTEGIAERHFAPAEVADLRALPRSAQARAFFDYWTLKEAYIKARGLGLALPLDAFAFRLDPPRAPTISFVAGFDDHAGRWAFHQAWPTSEHRLALAVERLGADVAVRFAVATPEALAARLP